MGAVTPLQPAKAWLAVILVSDDGRELEGGGSGQGQSALFLCRQGEKQGHREKLRGASANQLA